MQIFFFGGGGGGANKDCYGIFRCGLLNSILLKSFPFLVVCKYGFWSHELTHCIKNNRNSCSIMSLRSGSEVTFILVARPKKERKKGGGGGLFSLSREHKC